MGSATSVLSLLCGAFAMACTLASLCMDCWQINSKGSVVLSMRCRGLWGECIWDKLVRIWTCDVFGSYLNPQPAAVVLTRTLLIASGLASAAAFPCLLLGSEYFGCCPSPGAKRLCLRLATGLGFLAGLSSSAGSARYCAYVYSRHQHEVSLRIPGLPGFEFGSSLWLAAGGGLAALGAAALSCRRARLGREPRAAAAEEGADAGRPAADGTYV